MSAERGRGWSTPRSASFFLQYPNKTQVSAEKYKNWKKVDHVEE